MAGAHLPHRHGDGRDVRTAGAVSVSAGAARPGPRGTRYCLLLAAFDHAYWIFGVVAGAVAGAALPFAAKGIDFAMTALFLVILTDQCRVRANRLPAIVGAVSAVVAAVVLYFVFGSWKMLVPAMALIVAALLLLRRQKDRYSR